MSLKPLMVLFAVVLSSCSNKAGFTSNHQVKKEKASSDISSPETPVREEKRSVQVSSLEETSVDLTKVFPQFKFASVKTRNASVDWIKFSDDAPFSVLVKPDLNVIGTKAMVEFEIFGQEFVDYKINVEVSVKGPNVLAQSCDFQPLPVVGDVKPELMWHWKGYETDDKLMRFATTYSSPVVGDLDGNGEIEIVSIASQIFPLYRYSQENAVLVVLSAKDGSVLWNSHKDAGMFVESSTTPAIADLDGDGYAEIITNKLNINTAVTPRTISRELMIIDYKTKAPKYPNVPGFLCGPDCMPAVADLDQDGKFEIVIGNMIVSHEGKVVATLSTNSAYETIPNRNTASIAELVAQSEGLEIVANGSQVFSAKGTLLWKGECKGFSAVADLDKDSQPELVCIGGGKVYRYESDGQLMWVNDLPQDKTRNPIDPSRFRGGAPNLGNFDNDDALEIGTAGGDFYVVYNHDGSIVWQTATKDRSSHSTGSTVFDFNGDGKVEVAYNDEEQLRIYDGGTGTILFEVPNYSGTLWEYPVVANIDETDSVEIIVSAPGSGANDAQQGGVKVFRDPSNKWASSRKVWNQYSYYPSIVTEDLKSPKDVPSTASGFRVNTQDSLKLPPKVSAPDLVMQSSFAPLLDTAGKSVDGLVVVTNRGLLASTEDWEIQITAAKVSENSLVKLDTIAGSVVNSADFKLFAIKYSFEEPMSAVSVQIVPKIGVEFRECSDRNNTTN